MSRSRRWRHAFRRRCSAETFERRGEIGRGCRRRYQERDQQHRNQPRQQRRRQERRRQERRRLCEAGECKHVCGPAGELDLDATGGCLPRGERPPGGGRCLCRVVPAGACFPDPHATRFRQGVRSAAALVGDLVEVAALLADPVGLQVLRAGRKSDQASPATRPLVCHTTSNWPSARISPIITGLVMWWFGSIFDMPPVRFGTSMPTSRRSPCRDRSCRPSRPPSPTC